MRRSCASEKKITTLRVAIAVRLKQDRTWLGTVARRVIAKDCAMTWEITNADLVVCSATDQ